MSSALYRLVLLVSCAHALVHVYEMALPSVELQIAAERHPVAPSQPDASQPDASRADHPPPGDERGAGVDESSAAAAAGKRYTGVLSNSWRLMYGLGALLAGALVDRLEPRRMLGVYLLGCAAMCAAVGLGAAGGSLLAVMLVMGAFASIYHPAGLSLLSHETTPANRARALGVHGVFGSLGIGGAPFLAAAALGAGAGWRHYYWLLAAPGLALGLVFVWQAARRRPPEDADSARVALASQPGAPSDERGRWLSFFIVTVFAALQGFIYAAILSFLPRYLSAWRPAFLEAWVGSPDSPFFPVLVAGFVLAVGCVGQDLAGRLGRHERLESQLALVMYLNAPCLLWMAVAQDWRRPLAAGVFALVHFMHQPLYNSLIAKYTPKRRRSVCYGFSFAMGLGVGSFGAGMKGFATDEMTAHLALAAVAIAAGGVASLLAGLNAAHNRELAAAAASNARG